VRGQQELGAARRVCAATEQRGERQARVSPRAAGGSDRSGRGEHSTGASRTRRAACSRQGAGAP